MAKHLTDKEKKKIIADYMECGNYSETGRRNGVSRTIVRKVIQQNSDSAELFRQKKEENTQDIISYMDQRSKSFQDFVDYILDKRINPTTNKKELDSVSLPQLMTAFGILMDKLLKSVELKNKKAQTAAISQEDDGLEKAVMEAAQKFMSSRDKEEERDLDDIS